VVVPFLLVHDSNLAMRLSNVAGVVTLFVAGLALGRFASGHPWRYGVAMSLLGVVLVGVIVALGG
jgi:VIT1/CCC1 family predicted Fe2+/Mn2+ transporter